MMKPVNFTDINHFFGIQAENSKANRVSQDERRVPRRR